MWTRAVTVAPMKPQSSDPTWRGAVIHKLTPRPPRTTIMVRPGDANARFRISQKHTQRYNFTGRLPSPSIRLSATRNGEVICFCVIQCFARMNRFTCHVQPGIRAQHQGFAAGLPTTPCCYRTHPTSTVAHCSIVDASFTITTTAVAALQLAPCVA